MNNPIVFKVKTLLASVLTTSLIISTGVQSAPGNLASQPLFLGTNVQANIFFATDDSGSMDWETTLNAGTWNPGGVADTTIVHPPTDQEYRRATCLGYNVLAYNPATVYSPWKGNDEDGITYSDRTLTNALPNPYDNDNVLDISNHVYFIWNDLDNDGEYDGPGSIAFLAANDPATDECGDLASNTTPNAVAVNSLPATLNPSDAGYPNSQQNYANWYTYYRKRDYVAKRAMTELISNSNQRMGLATLHDRGGVGTSVTDMTSTSNKDALLDAVSRIDPANGTPLRILLRNTGRYFDKAGSNNDHQDLGFTDASPILPAGSGGECQQNFAVLFSDGFWNGSDPGMTNTDGDDNTMWDGDSYADTFDETLADVAMYYYETDLATGTADEVKPLAGIDENEAQHLTTYTVAFGVNGDLTSNPPNTTDPFAWPDPHACNDCPAQVDDMRHAAWNGRGEFLSARDPDTLISSLEDALASIENRIGTSTAVTFNSNELRADTQLYLTQFNSENWSGDIVAFNFNTDGSINPTEAWRVSDYLDSGSYNYANRVTYTLNDSTNSGTTLEWGNISTAQQNDFKTGPDGSIGSDADGQARMAYLLGDRTHEASSTAYDFRQRDSILGDIVHSGPVFVGVPNAGYPDLDPFGSSTKRYSSFVESNNTRKGIVYVGANDGMVHGFDTSASGAEVMTYVPAELYNSSDATSGLHYLSDPAYTHRYYVDVNLSSSDVFINTSGGVFGSANWETILAGGYGAGGRGVFALNITDETFPDSVAGAQDTVLWEFSDANSPYMGFSYSEPRIALLNNGKWAVLFGNGYNSDNGKAALIILYIEEGIDGTWTLNSDYKIIDTGVGDATNKSGIGQITVIDMNGDQVIDRVYGSGIDGKLWAFDLTDSNPNNWDSAYKAGSVSKPLFTAQTNQPITVKSAITRTESTTLANDPNVLVIVGTGQFLTDADPTSTATQSIYGIWDAGESEITISDLVQQTLETFSTSDRRVMTDNTVNYDIANPSNGDLGWYFNLPDTGERILIDPIIRLEQVFFATNIPSTQKCDDGGGDGWIMILDAENGGEPSQGGFDLNSDGSFDAADQISNKFVAGVKFNNGLPAGLGFLGGSGKLYITGTGSGGSIGGALSGLSSENIQQLNFQSKGRLAWKELFE